MTNNNVESQTSDKLFVKITVEYFDNTRKVLLFDDKNVAEERYNELVEQLTTQRDVYRASNTMNVNPCDIHFVHFEPLAVFNDHMMVLVDTTQK